jgi:hypothetical protein
MTTINMILGKAGDKIKIDDKIIKLQNSYKLITDDNNNNKYYEIETNNNKKFKINEEYLLKIINVRIDDVNYYNKWFTKDKKIYCNVNNCNINIVKYLFDKINDSKFRYSIRSDDDYDFRIENIKVYKSSSKNTEDRFIRMISPPIFYKEDEIRIIQEFQGYKITAGPHSGKYNNNYRLVEIINEPDLSNKRYYEMFVNVYNVNNEDNKEDDENEENNQIINTKFSFIFDEVSLPKILKLEANNLIINNPSWLIATVQYIYTRPSNDQLIYLHRYLMNCVIGDNKTIDHINNNKLDNRLCNLRIANMSEQNMNRANVTRKKDLNSILNPTNDSTIPRIETKSLLFINKKNSDGLEYFAVEISKARTRGEEIKESSSKSSLLTLKEKLCHAIYKRYEYICKYPIIMKEQIDGKQFATIDEFKLHSEAKINEVLGTGTNTGTVSITYTLDSFLDYLNTKKIPKYLDPRIKSRLESRLESRTAINTTQNVEEHSNANANNPYTYKIDDKFTFIDNGKNSRDIAIKINKNIKDNIRLSGSGSKKLSDEDKLCNALMNRYFILIEHENAINLEIHKDDVENESGITENKNTTGKHTLTDLICDGTKFTNFNDFKKHTEKIIKDIMLSTIPDNTFTIETFNTYIIDKINDKRCKKKIPILNTKYPILVT